MDEGCTNGGCIEEGGFLEECIEEGGMCSGEVYRGVYRRGRNV